MAKYRKRNKANYQSEKEERKKSKRNGSPRKKPLPVTKNVDLTVEKCPECDVDAKVKTETKDMVDIPRVPKAEKTQYRISKGKCESGHKIDTTPKGLTRGSAFGPNLMTQIVFLFFTALSLSSIAKALPDVRPRIGIKDHHTDGSGGGCNAEICSGGGPHLEEAGRLQVPYGGRKRRLESGRRAATCGSS